MLLSTFLKRYRTKPLLVGTLALCSCGSGLRNMPIGNLGASVEVIYSIDSENHQILRYTPNELGSVTLDSSIELPASLTATLVNTDTMGNVYVGGYTTSVNKSEVLVYAFDAADDEQPLRKVALEPGKLTALAVDRQSAIYAAQKNFPKSDKPFIDIYSSDDTAPVRTIRLATNGELNDLAVDSAGHLYVSGTNGRDSFIREYERFNGAAMRTVWAPHGSTFGGLAADDNGNFYTMRGMTLCEYGENATERSEPMQTINLPAGYALYEHEHFPNVLRRDGIGDFFVPVMTAGAAGQLNMVYGFASNAVGDATPILQFTAQDGAAKGPHGDNIPLAVF